MRLCLLIPGPWGSQETLWGSSGVSVLVFQMPAALEDPTPADSGEVCSDLGVLDRRPGGLGLEDS